MKEEPSIERASSELVVEPAPHVTGPMTKDLLMKYVFVALLILAALSTILWWSINTESGWSLGMTVAIASVISVGVAVGTDFLFSRVAVDSQLNMMSAAVFGLIVALSYSFGVPTPRTVSVAEILPLEAPMAYLYVAFISMIGMVLFKKLQGLVGRKFVNPAAAAKLVVFIPFLYQILLPTDHTLGIPKLTSPISFGVGVDWASFAGWLYSCLGIPTNTAVTFSQTDVYRTLILQKYHGWAGGASSIAVIAVGIGLFLVCRKYIKWRITLTYLVTAALLALGMSAIYGGDPLLRIGFHLFIGSSIFLAFFMATDPATTPLTSVGQVIFGVGLGVLTVLIQTYMSFFGGSILALVIMNLTVPLLDRVGIHKSFGR